MKALAEPPAGGSMNFRNIIFVAIVTCSAASIIGCGDNNLSKDDANWVHQQRLNQMYGSATVTSTSTVVNYVTITSTSTVTQ